VEAPIDAAPPTTGSSVPATPGRGSGSMELSADAASVMISGEPTGQIRVSGGAGGAMRLEAEKATMAALAEMLSRILDRPVVEMTKLRGVYQLTLNLSMQDMHAMVEAAGVMPSGPAMAGGDVSHRAGPEGPGGAQGTDPAASSVSENIPQLGLKLETPKATMEMIVIDRLEKAPREN